MEPYPGIPKLFLDSFQSIIQLTITEVGLTRKEKNDKYNFWHSKVGQLTHLITVNKQYEVG